MENIEKTLKKPLKIFWIVDRKVPMFCAIQKIFALMSLYFRVELTDSLRNFIQLPVLDTKVLVFRPIQKVSRRFDNCVHA
jgi:hypothetical protein